MFKLSKLIFAALISTIIAFSTLASAHESQLRNNAPVLVVYSDCEFDGDIDALTMGDYREMGDTRVGNDEISSLHVPHNMAAIIYEDYDFEGNHHVLRSDTSCLPRDWNDRISSIRFVPVSNLSYYVDNREQQTYKNQRSNQPIVNWNKTRKPVTTKGPQCHPYKLYTKSGTGGYRTINTSAADDFKRTDGKVVTGKICGTGNVQFSLMKNLPKTSVFLEVNNQRYVFTANQKHDVYRNKWYRKFYKVDLSNAQQQVDYRKQFKNMRLGR